MKKAELLQQLKEYLKEKINEPEASNAAGELMVHLEYAEARALVEALEGLRWANIFYTNPQVPGELGVEYEKFADAYQAHTDVQKIGLSIPFETVGIIRLKDSQDEN